MKRYLLDGQTMIVGNDAYAALKEMILPEDRILLVHGASFFNLPIADFLKSHTTACISFSGFSSNPKYEEVVAGRKLFLQEKCNCIISVGGGSAMDTAKSIKLFAAMPESANYIKEKKRSSSVRHLAIPTTAGTGSESNRNSVLYYQGEKQSLQHDSMLPDAAFLIPELTYTLPIYQKKATLMDALCQCFESFWAVKSSDVSRGYALRGLGIFLEKMDDYLAGDTSVNEDILRAANYSGRGINITQTTAAHAMSYKLSSMFQIAHGHAVALTLPHICAYAIAHPENTSDEVMKSKALARYQSPQAWLHETLDILRGLFCPGRKEQTALAEKLFEIVKAMEFPEIGEVSEAEMKELVQSVNVERLSNNPVKLDENALKNIYRRAVSPN